MSARPMLPSELEQLARDCGVQVDYIDAYGKPRQASAESLLAVFDALGLRLTSVDDASQVLAARREARLVRGLEPVLIAWEGAPFEFALTLPAEVPPTALQGVIALENGGDVLVERFGLAAAQTERSACGKFITRRLHLSSRLPLGYHRLTIDVAGRAYEALVIAAPRRAFAAPVAGRRDWGCFLPLYALRSNRNWGAGDFTDLQNLAAWMAQQGGRVVGTLPLLAAFLDEPFEPSPYAPASRLAWNEFYVDPARIPELEGCSAAAQMIRATGAGSEAAQWRAADMVDYRPIMARKREVLQLLADSFFGRKPAARYAEFEKFLQEHPAVEDYAAFRAAYEKRGEPWERWPDRLRGGELSAGDYDGRNRQYHLYAQWIATTQLEALVEATGGGLYLDLPLGVRPDGYDVWRWKELYAVKASAGSPPEPMWTTGQNWGFPPLHPETIRDDGYRHVRAYLKHHLRQARLLRIDHVMQLHRLYWIPNGLRRDQGVYVRYRPEEFYAVLTIESQRHQTTLVGENLGTVPPEVNRAMDDHGLRRMYVVQYEFTSPENDQSRAAARGEIARRVAAGEPAGPEPPALREVTAGSLASLNTHDMPAFAAWWRGLEIVLRRQLGLLTDDEVRREQEALGEKKKEIAAWLREAGWLDDSDPGGEPIERDERIVLALLKFLSASEAGVVLVNLEDLWLELQPQNVPGTGPELPNWKRKAALPLEEFTQRPEVLAALRSVDAHRRLGAAIRPAGQRAASGD